MAIADLDHPAELRRLLISQGVVVADADDEDLLYPPGLLRSAGDLDVVCPPGELWPAARALIEQGWELEALTWRPASGSPKRGG